MPYKFALHKYFLSVSQRPYDVFETDMGACSCVKPAARLIKANSEYLSWYFALQRRNSDNLIYITTMIPQEEDTRNSPAVAIHTIILALSAIFALVGNSLVCLAFYRNRRLRTVTNIYVLSLAVADIMGSALMPFSAVASGHRAWPFNFIFCQFCGFTAYLWGAMSINILALTAANRYICIVKPYLYPTLFTMKKTVLSILLFLLLTLTACLTATLATPILFQWHPLYLTCEVAELEIQAGVSKNSVGFVGLAMSLIIFCYGSVYRTIKQHNAAVNPSLQDTTSQATVSLREIQASRVLLATVIGFAVCWIPVTIGRILERDANSAILSSMLSFSALFAAFSSWINPVIYGVMNRAMRKEFLKLLHCRSKTGNR